MLTSWMIYLCLLGSRALSNDIRAYPNDQPLYERASNAFYSNDFDHYPEDAVIWGGQSSVLWTTIRMSSAHSAPSLLNGNSASSGAEGWAVSDRFMVPQSVDHLSISMKMRFWHGVNTWQVVPQGSDAIMARFIVNPDGSVSVFDADTHGEWVRTSARVRLDYFDDFWEDLEFKLNRRANRYSIFLNGERIHTGTPYSRDIESIAFVQTMNSASVRSHIDTIVVAEDFAGVPTLQSWALLALIASLFTVALFQRRKMRLQQKLHL